MPMHDQVGNHEFIKASINTLLQHLESSPENTKAAIAETSALTDKGAVEVAHQKLLNQLKDVKAKADAETPMPYFHYASRFDVVGLYQAVLSKIFSDIPELQGYGDRNAIWAVTPIEHIAYVAKSFFVQVYANVHSRHEPLLNSFLKAWKDLSVERAEYPKGIPDVIPFPEECEVALLADWGGDNPAAKRVAAKVIKANPEIAIHLGDIYYGGIEAECRAFLNNWPSRSDGKTLRANANFALNGNHEMYSGGESYFNVVLPAFGQRQPFFCLENAYWRLIGLDTAYNGGSLRPTGPNDPLNAQWNWLVALLRKKDGKANIFLTHHQPVSAHTLEFGQSESLRADIKSFLATDGIEPTAIFGWFFGHEHRCAIYETDPNTHYLPRLIGSGCIPHVVQTEITSDPGCSSAQWFNKRAENGHKESAISMFAELRFVRDQLVIDYIDEDGLSWGSETWYSDPGRMTASGFTPADGIEMVGTR